MTPVDRAALDASMAEFRRLSTARQAKPDRGRDPIADMEPAEHEALVRAEHAQIEATIAWAEAQAEVRKQSPTDTSALASDARKRAADSLRKVAERQEARVLKPPPFEQDRAA